MADLEVLPVELNLSFWRGDDIVVPFTFATGVDDDGNPTGVVDVSSWTIAAQVRQAYTSRTTKAVFTVDMTDAASGTIVLSISAEDSAAITGTKFVWDLQTIDGGTVSTRVFGTFTLDGDVTREDA